MKKRGLRLYLGFVFVILGVLLSFLTRYFCGKLCGACLLGQAYPCDFLFLFVGIILVVSGTSLVLTSQEKAKKHTKNRITT